MLILFVVRICRSVCWYVSAVEGGGEGAGGGLIVACGGGVGSTREGGSIAYRDAILSVVDASTVGENMNICAFRTKLAVSLSLKNDRQCCCGLETLRRDEGWMRLAAGDRS